MYNALIGSPDGLQSLLKNLAQIDNPKVLSQAFADIMKVTITQGLWQGSTGTPFVHSVFYTSKEPPRSLSVTELAHDGTHEVIHGKAKRIEYQEGTNVVFKSGFSRNIVDTENEGLEKEYDRLNEGVVEMLNAFSRHPDIFSKKAPLAQLHMVFYDDVTELKNSDSFFTKELAAESMIRVMEVAFDGNEEEGFKLLGNAYFNSDLNSFFDQIRDRLSTENQSAFDNYAEACRANDLDAMSEYADIIHPVSIDIERVKQGR